MRGDFLNSSSGQDVSTDGFSEVGGIKKVMTFGGDTAEGRLDSASTAFSDNDIIAYAGELDTSLPTGLHVATKILVEKIVWMPSTATGNTMVGNISAGTAANEAVNGAVTGQVELFGAGATYRNANLAADLSITEVDIDFNGSTIQYAQPLIILPAATKYIYVCTTTAINHATNFDAGKYNLAIHYTVL